MCLLGEKKPQGRQRASRLTTAKQMRPPTPTRPGGADSWLGGGCGSI